jgi:AcrR family transcriptional regulator
MKKKAGKIGGIRPDIVHAAARVFGSSGYERATLDEVASLVGIQKGSLYHHIDSKEQLLFAIHLQLNEEIDRRMTAATADKASGALKRIERIVGAFIETVAQHREMVSVFLRDYRALEPNHLEEVLQHRRHLLKRVETEVRQAFAEERQTDLDVRYTVYAIIGMCYWVNEWLDGRNLASAGQGITRDDHHAIAVNFSRILIDGLRSRNNDGEAPKAMKKAVRRRAHKSNKSRV